MARTNKKLLAACLVVAAALAMAAVEVESCRQNRVQVARMWIQNLLQRYPELQQEFGSGRSPQQQGFNQGFNQGFGQQPSLPNFNNNPQVNPVQPQLVQPTTTPNNPQGQPAVNPPNQPAVNPPQQGGQPTNG